MTWAHSSRRGNGYKCRCDEVFYYKYRNGDPAPYGQREALKMARSHGCGSKKEKIRHKTPGLQKELDLVPYQCWCGALLEKQSEIKKHHDGLHG